MFLIKGILKHILVADHMKYIIQLLIQLKVLSAVVVLLLSL